MPDSKNFHCQWCNHVAANVKTLTDKEALAVAAFGEKTKIVLDTLCIECLEPVVELGKHLLEVVVKG